jgi:hypothetical protein
VKKSPTLHPPLFPLAVAGADVLTTAPGSYRLSIPPGPAKQYRCAQLDDYKNIHDRQFDWQSPLRLEVSARISLASFSGTWGFGLWNDPFSASQGLGGMSRRLPALPNTAWFFFASSPNYLALCDDHPAVGFLAATFSSPNIPSLLLSPGLLFLPLLAIRPAARFLRRLARIVVHESAAPVATDPTQWHQYRIDWYQDRAIFWVDNAVIHQTLITPRGRLGLVLWIDNQYMAFTPTGTLRFGTLETTETTCLELDGLALSRIS